LIAGGLTAGAAPIAIINNSFESDLTGFTGNAYIDGIKDANNPGRLDPTVGMGGDGVKYAVLAYGNKGPLSQNTSFTIAVNDVGSRLTLIAAVGDEAGNSGVQFGDDTADKYVGTVRLLLDGTVVASNLLEDTGDAPAGGFANATTYYTVLAGDIGKVVGVGINTTETQGGHRRSFDNLRLDIAPVPEPGSVLLSLVGGGALLARRRRRQIA
jgi:hypothetical protein